MPLPSTRVYSKADDSRHLEDLFSCARGEIPFGQNTEEPRTKKGAPEVEHNQNLPLGFS